MDTDIQRLVLSYCKKNYNKWKYLFDRDDFIQECYLIILSNMNKYNNTLSKLSTYIYNVLSNTWGTFLNSKKGKQLCFEKSILPIEFENDEQEEISLENFSNLNESTSVTDYIDHMENMRNLKNLVPYMRSYTFEYYILGTSVTDLAKKYNTTKQNMSQKIQYNIKFLKSLFTK